MKRFVLLVSFLTGMHVALPLQANVFGELDREKVEYKMEMPRAELRSPVEHIGFLQVGKNSVDCSAILVGRNLILTARHCLSDSEENITKRRVHYVMNYPDQGIIKEFATEAHLIIFGNAPHFTFIDLFPFPDDWAFLRLKDSLPANLGYFLFSDDFDASVNSPSYGVAGYSKFFEGGSLTYQSGCSIKGSFDMEGRPQSELDSITSFYYHDCDMAKGDSGGPVFLANTHYPYFPTLIGMNIAAKGTLYSKSISDSTFPEYSSEYANVSLKAAIIALHVYYRQNELKTSDRKLLSEVINIGHKVCLKIHGRACPEF